MYVCIHTLVLKMPSDKVFIYTPKKTLQIQSQTVFGAVGCRYVYRYYI